VYSSRKATGSFYGPRSRISDAGKIQSTYETVLHYNAAEAEEKKKKQIKIQVGGARGNRGKRDR